MSKLFNVSQSKVKTWRKCHAAYHYRYVEKLKKIRKSRPLQFGTIIHSMLEAEANAEDPMKVLSKISFDNEKMFAAEKEMYGELVQDIGTIMKAYFNYWGEDSLHFLRKNKKSAEHEFEIEIAPGISMNGKIDAVAQTPKNKLKWLQENKSFGKQLPDADTRWRNLQSAVYFRALEMLGWFPGLSGSLWNYICSKPPTKPELLKSGKLSEKKINTLPSVVIATIKEHGLKTKDYQKLIQAAESNQQNYFTRIFHPIQKGTVDIIFNGFIDTAKEMLQYHGTKTDMNIEKHCSWCDYEPLCRAKLSGSDVEYIKQREYTHGDKRKEVEPVEERELGE